VGAIPRPYNAAVFTSLPRKKAASTLRDRIRAWRMYFKSYPLMRATLSDSERALVLPFAERVDFHARATGAALGVPGACWSMLPTVCRLVQIGALPSWEDDMLKVRFGNIVLYAPGLDKSIGWTLREILVDDAYGLRGMDLKGRTVLDVGAYIGDSTIAFAARGAFVHAFEPVPMVQQFLVRNVAANAMEGRVRVHPVGLAREDRRVKVDVNVTGLAGATVKAARNDARAEASSVSQELHLVDALDYLRSAGVTAADVVKLDCEGAEYALLEDGALLEMLQPSRVVMEYHRGGAPLHDALVKHGYRVDWPAPRSELGYMHGVRGREPA